VSRPSERPAPARHARRLGVDALERYARQRCADRRDQRIAMLAVGLERSDRMRALGRRDDAMRVLATLLDRIDAALRPDDRFAVVAVDEVWVLLADAPAESIVRLAASSLRERIDAGYDGRLDDGTPVRVTVATTIGGAFVDDATVPMSHLVEVAGRALAEAHGAEDRIAILGISADSRRLARVSLETRLRRALEANELEIWYQPQVTLGSLRCDSLEALVRWSQPGGAMAVSPALLVSICEDSGMIGELTRFNLNTVLRMLMGWKARGLAPRVGINLSALTLADASFPAQVSQACETWGVPPSQLLFELTESSLARNEGRTIDFMHRLRALGCGLSIDDFGTGYSSFSYLRQFPVDELKIDRAFVRRLATDAADRRIVKVLVEIAHAFGLRALAEGIEDAESVAVLVELGCDAVQGWQFSRALPADDVPDWIERFNARSDRSVSFPETLGTA
jgi:EAL domain-containing protein (putative c-di-GMP-specific phosphodiesterase class I)/GGDEF domain-containing protein